MTLRAARFPIGAGVSMVAPTLGSDEAGDCTGADLAATGLATAGADEALAATGLTTEVALAFAAGFSVGLAAGLAATALVAAAATFLGVATGLATALAAGLAAGLLTATFLATGVLVALTLVTALATFAAGALAAPLGATLGVALVLTLVTAALGLGLAAALTGAAFAATFPGFGLDTTSFLTGTAALAEPWRAGALAAGAGLTVFRVAAFTACLLSDPDDRDGLFLADPTVIPREAAESASWLISGGESGLSAALLGNPKPRRMESSIMVWTSW